MNFSDKFFRGVNKKEAISWAFYDFANSAYFLLIVSFVFPIFFREVIAGGGTNGDFWWGLATSISILLGGLASPIVGAIADHDSRRKRKLMIFGVLSMIGTAALYFTGPNMLIFALALFILTNLFFEIALTLYDSFLPRVSNSKTSGRISGLGWGLGYVGGIIAMLIFRPLYEGGYADASLYKLTFPLVALFFFVFALPAFIFLKDPKRTTPKEGLFKLAKIGISNTLQTIKEIRKHKHVAQFLLGFYILNDALVTIFTFIPIYANATLQMTLAEITIVLLVVQIIGFPSAIFFGWLSDHKGSKKMLLLTVILWGLIVLGLAFATSKSFFYIIAIFTGLVIGSSQSIARSWFSKIIPQEKSGEFFGFNGFASKVAATTGPLLFGIISAVTANQRIAMGTLVVYFIISFFIFLNLKEVRE